MSYELVWFKRDLRLHDHAALTCAANKGLVRCIYIVEPDLWKLPDVALQHFEFIKESLIELHEAMQNYGGAMEIHTGVRSRCFKSNF
jgi:deoxyribodipyrimidine photo-lyase